MEMTFDQASSKLFAVLEAAIYNYEIEVMVEEADGGSDNAEATTTKESKFANLKQLAGKVFGKIWGWILKAIDGILTFVMKWRGPVTVTKDMTVYPGALSFDGKLMQYANELSNGNFSNYDDAIDYFNGIQMDKKLTKGSTIMANPIKSTMQKYKAAITRLEGAMKRFKGSSEDMNKINVAIKRAAAILGTYVKQCNEIVNMYNEADKEKLAEQIGKKRENREAKAQKKNDKEFNKYQKEFHESGIDTSALAQTLLAEAARLISEDAADNTDGIDGGKVLSDNIPEEKPVVDNEYPADAVTGGEGDGSDSDAIKDLVDGDNEALKILTDDKGSETVTESVIIRF